MRALASPTSDARRPLRYLLAGTFNTLASYSVYGAGLLIGLGVARASLLALLLGVLIGFCTQGGLVFGRMTLASFVRFVAAWGLMYGVFLGTVAAMAMLGVGPLLGGVAGTAAVTLLSYFVLRDLVFRAGSAAR